MKILITPILNILIATWFLICYAVFLLCYVLIYVIWNFKFPGKKFSTMLLIKHSQVPLFGLGEPFFKKRHSYIYNTYIHWFFNVKNEVKRQPSKGYNK